MLCATGQQFMDWSAAYRLFSAPRFDTGQLFAVARRTVAQMLQPNHPFVVSLDDTHLRKTGKKVYGAGWKRDPLGPPFQTNLIWAQRYLQCCACLPVTGQTGPATSVPIAFTHAPSPKKPKKNATKEEKRAYAQARKEMNLSKVAVQHIQDLRRGLDEDAQNNRTLWLNVDGSFTNGAVLKALPERTILTGRIRKDAALHYPPDNEIQSGPGRKRLYGKKAPTPEQLRQDEDCPWQIVSAWAAGKMHDFRIKTVSNVQWRTAGANHVLRLIVIAPLGYRLHKEAKLLYRKPAFLICTDPEQPLELVLQHYLWRWGIEANHRDEKQIIGVGQAQVRTRAATKNVPAFLVAAYALLRLAARRAAEDHGACQELPQPLWNRRYKPQPACTTRLVQQLRAELWGKAMGINFSDFAKKKRKDAKPEKSTPELASAVLYALN
jgi:DDE superfamily endonuclease